MKLKLGNIFGRRAESLLALGGATFCASALHFGLFNQTSFSLSDPLSMNITNLVPVAIFTGFGLFAGSLAVYSLRALQKSRDASFLTNYSQAHMTRLLETSDALVKSEPHVLLIWDKMAAPHLTSYKMDHTTAVPQDAHALLDFANWLEPASANEMRRSLKFLLRDGHDFSILIRTHSAHHLQASGRIAAGMPVLKIRNVAGSARDLCEIFDDRRRLYQMVEAQQNLLNSLPVSVWFRDHLGRLEWVNEHYIRSVKANALIDVQKQQIELFELRQRKDIADHLHDEGLFSKKVHTIVDGERRAFATTAISIEDKSAGAAIDVGAIENVEDQLQNLISAHTGLLDKVSTAVCMFSSDKNLRFCNRAFLQMWGLGEDWPHKGRTEDELLDELRRRRQLPEDPDFKAWRANHMGPYRSAEPLEQWWHLPDGRRIHVLSEQGPDGGVNRLFDDVSSRLELEGRYNALIGEQRETLDNLVEAVAVFGSDGRLKLHNPAFQRIWELDTINLSAGPHIEKLVQACRRLYDDLNIWQEISSKITAIGQRTKPIGGLMDLANETSLTYSALTLPDGSTLLTFSDMTDSRRVEKALIERNEALEESDHLKNAFLSHVSYELRTPLTNIIGFSDLLSGGHVGDLSGKQMEYVKDIQASSQTLLAIINDILDLASIDAGNLDLTFEEQSITDIINLAHQSLMDMALERNIDVQVYMMGDLPNIMVDRLRMIQVMHNLLSNAIGFSTPGSSVKVNCWQEDETIVISVADEGCGIEEDQIDQMFERFEMNTTSGHHRGVGLGLPIVKSVVELHGGRVFLQSSPDVGTTVTVRLPKNITKPISAEQSA